jgi:two-component system LytT family response regulator
MEVTYDQYIMKYKCIIVDDSELDYDILNMHLAKMDQLEVIASCRDGFSAQKVLASTDVDIVFSDINMPDLSGIGLLKSLRHAPVFIFTSSHAEHAVESFDLDVIDFILKPVTLARVVKAVNKAIEYIELKKRPVDAKTDAMPDTKDDHFFFRESGKLIKLNYADIAYIESMGHFSKIRTISDKIHVTLVSLKNLEKHLPGSFFIRIHKQFIINYHNISSISAADVILADKYPVILSTNYRQDLLDKIGNNKIVTRTSQNE